MSACCGPRRFAEEGNSWNRPPAGATPRKRPRPDSAPMVRVPGGVFLMGDDREEAFASDGEGPVREVELRPFLMDTTAVTNAQFAAFTSIFHEGSAVR